MRTTKNKYILSRMGDKTYNVIELPCGWLIIDISSARSGYLLDLTKTYYHYLKTDAVFYDGELINDEGRRWSGLTLGATMDPSIAELITDPIDAFISRKYHMAWDATGHCIHGGPAPFDKLDEYYDERIREKMAQRKTRKEA